MTDAEKLRARQELSRSRIRGLRTQFVEGSKPDPRGFDDREKKPRPKCGRGHEQAMRWTPKKGCWTCALEDHADALAEIHAEAMAAERRAALAGWKPPVLMSILEVSTGRRIFYKCPPKGRQPWRNGKGRRSR
jgi:hypothetical protein